MKICVLGLGYIGLPTALLFAQKYEVIGVDVNREVVDKLNNGETPFDEPGLDDLFEKARAVNSDAQLYRQAGNAVTVNVAYAVACSLPSE